jgi:hypothetical protein
VSQPGDAAERDADRRADAVMRMAQPEPSAAGAARASDVIARKAVAAPSVRNTSGVAPIVRTALDAPGAPLDRTTRAFFEPRFGADLGHVRIHSDGAAAAAACSIEAHAFTVGADVGFAAGDYDPHSSRGRALLAHELAHTLQPAAPAVVQRKPLTDAEKLEDLQSPTLRNDQRLQQAFDNAPLLKKNETSEGVKTLQRALKELGYPLPISFAKSGDADGIFEDETEAQVKQFQRDNHISDDGDVGRDTLRALDDKFNPRITIEKIYILSDRHELVNNKTDWSPTGPQFVDWAGAPGHVVFTPDALFAESIPVTVTAGEPIHALARVHIKGGIDGRTYTVSSAPMEAMPGWTLSGTGTHHDGLDVDLIDLNGEAPVTDKIAFQEFLMTWGVTTFVDSTSAGISQQQAFVTAGPAHKPGTVDHKDRPNVPTFRRLRQAVRFTAGTSATQVDRIIFRVFRHFSDYGVCDVPMDQQWPGFTCPMLDSVWEMTDHIGSSHFQCITISRYVNAYLNVLGVPEAMRDATVRPVVVWADPANAEKGLVNPYPHPGIGIPSIVHPQHPDWALVLLDGNCDTNNYEACIELKWTPPGASDPVVQYYCGGVDNPRAGFATPREVLNEAFDLAYVVPMSKNDPDTGFPRGIRKKDVKVYDPDFGRCPGGLCCKDLP